MPDSDNMNNNQDHIIGVCPEQQVPVNTTPRRQSSSSSSTEVVIAVDEISVSMENTTSVITHPEATAFISAGETRHCRFCHEEDLITRLEAPCSCIGTLRYAHRSCTTAWCNTKGDIMCAICEQPYGLDYAVTENSSTHTRVAVDSVSPSTPTTITQVQSPMQLPERRPFSLSQYAYLMVPCRGLLYATLLILFLVVLVVNDVLTFTKTTKKEPRKAFNILLVVILMLLAPLSILSCLYECRALIAQHLDERNRRGVEGEGAASRI